MRRAGASGSKRWIARLVALLIAGAAPAAAAAAAATHGHAETGTPAAASPAGAPQPFVAFRQGSTEHIAALEAELAASLDPTWRGQGQ